MNRIVSLLTSTALTLPIAALADEPKSEPKKPQLQKSAPERAEVARELKTQPGSTRTQAQVIGLSPGASVPAGGVWNDGKSMSERHIEQVEKVVKLTDEQKQRIRRLFEIRESAAKEIQAAIEAKRGALSRALEEASKSKNQEAITKAQKAFTDLYAPMSELTRKSLEELQNVLTAEQRGKLQDNQLTTMIGAMAPGVKLSEAQLKAVKDGVSPANEHQMRWGANLQELLEKTLTEEQAAGVLKQRAVQFATMQFQAAKLTPEQLRKLEQQAAEVSKASKHKLQLDPTAYNKLTTFVDSLLTAEQREAMKKSRVGFAGGGGWVALAGGQIQAGAATPNPGAPQQLQNVKVSSAPGGGIQIFVTEGGAAGAVISSTEQLEQQKQIHIRMQELSKQAQASHREMMRNRIRRQRELTKQASKLLKKIDELKPEDQAKAQQLWQQIEQTQAQLHQSLSFPGAAGAVMMGSGMAGPEGGVWSVKTWPDRPGVVEFNGQRITPPGADPQPLNPQAVRTQSIQVGSPINAPQPPHAETMKAIEDLRRQIDQLRGEVRKLSEKK